MDRTQAQEDYLKTIYKIKEQQNSRGEVSNGMIADWLNVSPASVTNMLQNLKKKKLVTIKPYRGVALTTSGLSLAIDLIRRHRIIETYLVKRLQYSWDEVDCEAEILEHSVSNKMVDRMWEELDKPAFDPHGSPIPDKNGMIAKQSEKKLINISQNEEVEVVRIKNTRPSELRHLSKVGLKVRTRLKILQNNKSKGKIILQVDSQQQQLDSSLANAILVSPIISNKKLDSLTNRKQNL